MYRHMYTGIMTETARGAVFSADSLRLFFITARFHCSIEEYTLGRVIS